MKLNLPIDTEKVKGFLDPLEGEVLYAYSKIATKGGPALEIGSYCGKSAIYIGFATKENGEKLYSIDHHKGSEEQQPGEEYFDPDLVDKMGKGIDTLPSFLATIRRSKLEGVVIPVVSTSEEAFANLRQDFSFVFIDGGHSEEAAQNDYKLWSKRLTIGGILACLLYTSPSPRDATLSRMPSSA